MLLVLLPIMEYIYNCSYSQHNFLYCSKPFLKLQEWYKQCIKLWTSYYIVFPKSLLVYSPQINVIILLKTLDQVYTSWPELIIVSKAKLFCYSMYQGRPLIKSFVNQKRFSRKIGKTSLLLSTYYLLKALIQSLRLLLVLIEVRRLLISDIISCKEKDQS